MAKFDPDIVLEFYANAWPTEEGVRDMRSWVRGQWIPFDVAQSGDGVVISQRKYALDILEETGMQNCRPVESPMDPNTSAQNGSA